MKSLKIFLYILLLLAGQSVFSQTTCNPNGSGGYNCFDYETGSFSSSTPNGSGGYNTYDYDTGSFGTITPNGSGGYDMYEY